MHETALGIASKEAVRVSLRVRLRNPRQHELSKDLDEHPTYYSSPRERILSFAQPAEQRSELVTTNIFSAIQMPETEYRGDAVELT